MRFLLTIALLALTAAAQPNAVKGQASVRQLPLSFGTNVSTVRLIVLNTSYKVATSGGAYATYDTAANAPYTSAPGACTKEITIEDAAAVIAEKNLLVHYRMRCTDTGDCGIRFKVYKRWAGPTQTDTAYMSGQSLWDSTRVIDTHTPFTRSATAYSWDAKFGVQAARAKVCVERTDVGSGDTVFVTMDGRLY